MTTKTTLKLDEEWSIYKWIGANGHVWYDIWHNCGDDATGCRDQYGAMCYRCHKKIPDCVLGFLQLCRSDIGTGS